MSRRGALAAAAVVAIGAAIAVPYCDVLFDCGCNWPWNGLVDHCNIHNPKAPAHCPWCERPMFAFASFFAAASAGAFVAYRGDGGPTGSGPRAGRAGRGGAAPVLRSPSRTAGAVRPVPNGPARPAAASARSPAPGRSARADLAVRILSGTGVFLVVALAAGLVTKIVTGYPRFLFFGS